MYICIHIKASETEINMSVNSSHYIVHVLAILGIRVFTMTVFVLMSAYNSQSSLTTLSLYSNRLLHEQ